MASIAHTQNITPFLWFDHEAEEAAQYYCSIFKDAKITDVVRFGHEQVMTVRFEIEGFAFVALNGGRTERDGTPLGPSFDLKASTAVSFVISPQTQAEVDELWEKLGAGGRTMQCGWLKDKFGVTWQIVPAGFVEMLQDEDPERASRAMRAMMEMEKLDINALREVVGAP